MIRFVTPETVTLHLADVQRRAHAALVADKKATKEALDESQAQLDAAIADGAFIVIKKQLSHGERDEVYARVRAGKSYRTAEVAAYLVNWSAPEAYAPDLPLDDRFAILDNLDIDSFDEIQAAIKAHVDALEQEKKLLTGATASAPTFASV